MLRKMLFSVVVALLSIPGIAHAVGQNNIGIDAGVSQGGFAIGADYEYMMKQNLGVGGYIHYFPKSDTTPVTDGLFAFGVNSNVHYKTGAIDGYFGPGLGFVNITSAFPNQSSTLTFGPRATLGLLYQFNDSLAVGFEDDAYWSWFATDFNGLLINDFSVKLRVTF